MTRVKAVYHHVSNDLHDVATEACRQMAQLLQGSQNEFSIRYWLILRAGKSAQMGISA